jgi:hypothetical protein
MEYWLKGREQYRVPPLVLVKSVIHSSKAKKIRKHNVISIPFLLDFPVQYS